MQWPQCGWHQFAAPQKESVLPVSFLVSLFFHLDQGEGRRQCFRDKGGMNDLPQKLLPLQHSPSPHLAFTIGPQVSPIPTVFGGLEGRGGAVRLVEQSPNPSWQVSAPQYRSWLWMLFLGPQWPPELQQR